MTEHQTETDTYAAQIIARILNETNEIRPDFIRATISGTRHRTPAGEHPWVRLVIRPVLLKNRLHLQFSWFDRKQNFVKNYTGEAAMQQLQEALALPFANYTILTTGGDLQVQITKKGKALVHHHAASHPAGSAEQPVSALPEDLLAHDRAKATPLNLVTAAPFLQAVGIMTQDRRIRSDRQSKFAQINEFLRLLDETNELSNFEPGRPIQVLDCGCGNAYLTFALYHYLTVERGLACVITGIDTNARLLDNHTAKVQALGWEHLHFQATRIEDYVPETPPDIVIALHACDTATDDALAQGIRWNSRLMMVVPCCQHHLQAQLSQQPTPAPFGEVMRYGLMHERVGDLLTDSFRALLLRLAGYRVDVAELVGTEHTPKNLMLRAVQTGRTGDPRLTDEYEALKAFWQVTPYLESLLTAVPAESAEQG